MKFDVVFFFFLFCTSLSQSQTPALPNLPSLSNIPIQPPSPPATYSTLPTSATPPSSTVKDPLAPLLNSVQPANPAASDTLPGPKYKEFLSICRTNEYDTIYFLNEDVKEQRIKLIEEKVKADPSSIKLQLRLLKEYVDQRKVKEAEHQLLLLKGKKAADDDITLANGMVSYLKKDRKKARDYLNKILTSQPKNLEALKWLAEEYKAELNYFEAHAIYDDMAKISSENTLQGICEVLTLDAHYTEAEPICLRGSAQKKDPFFDIFLGIAAREKNNIKAARKYFSDSMKIKDTEMAHVCLAETYAMEHKYSDAEKNYLLALKVTPRSMRALAGLAWSYFNEKDRITALDYFKKACSFDRKMAAEVRSAVKILLDEKAEISQKYIEQAQRCGES